MSDITCTVIPGYVLAPDASGKAWLTYVRLNQLGVPTVTVSLAGVVAAADLATALSAKILGPDISVAAEVSDAISVTVQMQNAVGSDVAGRFAFRCWLSDSAHGALTGTAPNTDTTITTGVEIQEVVSKTHFIVETDADGTAVIKIDNAVGATHSWYLMAEIQGIVTASAIITITV